MHVIILQRLKHFTFITFKNNPTLAEFTKTAILSIHASHQKHVVSPCPCINIVNNGTKSKLDQILIVIYQENTTGTFTFSMPVDLKMLVNVTKIGIKVKTIKNESL